MTKNANLLIAGILATMLSGCILLEDTGTSNQASMKDSEKWNNKDEAFKKSMNKEKYFDSLSRVSNGKTSNEPPTPVNF